MTPLFPPSSTCHTNKQHKRTWDYNIDIGTKPGDKTHISQTVIKLDLGFTQLLFRILSIFFSFCSIYTYAFRVYLNSFNFFSLLLSKKYSTEKLLLELTYFSPKSHVILQKKADKAVYESPFYPHFFPSFEQTQTHNIVTLTLLFMSFSVINTSHTFREAF